MIVVSKCYRCGMGVSGKPPRAVHKTVKQCVDALQAQLAEITNEYLNRICKLARGYDWNLDRDHDDVEELELSVRAAKTLKNIGITSISVLLDAIMSKKLTNDGYYNGEKLANFGRKSYWEIVDAVHAKCEAQLRGDRQ